MKIHFLILAAIVLAAFISPAQGQKKPAPRLPNGKRYVFKAPALPPKVIVPEDWQEFSSGACKFKASFPKPPSESETEGMSYNITLNIFTFQSYVNGNYYLISVFEYPKDFLSKRSDIGEDYAAWMAKNLIKVDNILRVKKVNYDGFTGYEFLYREGPNVVLHRAVVAGPRLYQLILYLEANNKEENDKILERNKEKIDKFFDSFKLSERPLEDPSAG